MILKKNIDKTLYLFLFTHLLLWTLIPTFSNTNLHSFWIYQVLENVISSLKMLNRNQQMLTKIQQMLIVEEIHIFYCLIVSKCFSNVNYLLISQKRYLQLFLVRKIYVKMVQKTKNVKTSKKNFSVNSKDMMTWVCLDENMSPRSVLNTLSYSQTHYS